MISQKVVQHHLDRLYPLAQLIEEALLDTDNDKRSEQAVKALKAEWWGWCDVLNILYPAASPLVQVDKLFAESGYVDYTALEKASQPIVERFKQAGRLMERLEYLYSLNSKKE